MTATDDTLEAMREALADHDNERFVELLRTLATLDPEAAGMVATVMGATRENTLQSNGNRGLERETLGVGAQSADPAVSRGANLTTGSTREAFGEAR